MYLPALPALTRDFHAQASSVQLTLSACLLGLAAGQIVIGPLSDAYGRRRPLLIGVAAYGLASLLCVFAPSVGALIALRFIQGVTGAAGIVISRAIVRDMYSGVAMARFFSLLMLVNGLAPILAPVIGAQLLRFTSWRGTFVTLSIIGALMFLSALLGIQETLPPESRHEGGIRATLATFKQLLGDRSFIGCSLCGGLGFAAMFAYISGSPFVLQDIYGVSPQVFSAIFGMNAAGLILLGQLNARLTRRVPLRRLLIRGLLVVACAGLLLLAVVVSGSIGLIGVLPALFMVVASQGMIGPNSTALALTGHPSTAGSASALLGVTQFAIGAAASPLVGIGGTATAVPMAVVIALCGAGALLTGALFVSGETVVLTRDN